jgi:signal transduction histidine kinase
MADPAQLQQILVNLVVNALDATPAGGRVRLTATASTEGDRPTVAIEVSDTGRGIAPELQPRIFEPFFTTKAAGGGTGLGLAIARDIVRAHDGDIRVRSEIGVGTTFTVVLPQAIHVPAALGGESR